MCGTATMLQWQSANLHVRGSGGNGESAGALRKGSHGASGRADPAAKDRGALIQRFSGMAWESSRS